jgi:hypothetical protein
MPTGPSSYACLPGRKETARFPFSESFLPFALMSSNEPASDQKDELLFMGVTPLIVTVRKGFNARVADLVRGRDDAAKLDLIAQSAIDCANQKTGAIRSFEAYVEKQPAANGEEEDARDDE